jgi:hypothetical protein
MTMNDLTPTATIECDEHDGSFTVRASYPHAGTDRVTGRGWSVLDKGLAERMAVALEAGAVLTDATIKTDVNGRTYVAASSQVLGRKMNADLTRLGY